MTSPVLPDPIDLETLVRTAAFQALLKQGKGVTPAHLAHATGIHPEKLQGLIDRLDQSGRIRVDPLGLVVGSAGLSVMPDRHAIQVEGRRFWTWCAYDIFGIFGALGASGRALSPSPLDGKPIEVRFVDGRPQHSDAVLFRPDSELMECCHNVYEEWCPNSNLFADRKLAERWADDHNLRGSVLNLYEAADLATEAWRPVTDAAVNWTG